MSLVVQTLGFLQQRVTLVDLRLQMFDLRPSMNACQRHTRHIVSFVGNKIAVQFRS